MLLLFFEILFLLLHLLVFLQLVIDDWVHAYAECNKFPALSNRQKFLKLLFLLFSMLVIFSQTKGITLRTHVVDQDKDEFEI